MPFSRLTQQQKDTVWRYAHCAGLWRRNADKRYRNFASLEQDMSAGYDILGIAIDETSDHPLIIGAAQDPEFFAAIFRDNNSAIPNMRADDLERLRRFIIHGNGELP